MYRLLIADDERTIRMGLRTVIDWAELGFEVAGVAANGREALEIVENTRIDVILTDIQMPELTGLELARRAEKLNPGIRIVIISGYSNFEYAQESIELRVEGYILKPIDIRQLRELFLRLKERLDRDRQIEALLSGTADLEQKYCSEIIAAIEADGSAGFREKESALEQELRQLPREDALRIYRRILKSAAEYFQFPQDGFALDREDSGTLLPEQLADRFRQDVAQGLQYILTRTEQTTALIGYRAREEIRQSYMDPGLSMRELAEKLNVSYGYLSSIFTEQFGISIKSYLIQVRMEKAWELLLQRRLKIYEIAIRVGYTNTRYFSDAFRKYYGVSPTQKIESLHQTLSGAPEEERQ